MSTSNPNSQPRQSSSEIEERERETPVFNYVPSSGHELHVPKKMTIEEAFGNVDGKAVFYGDINSPTIDEWPDP